MNKNAMDSICGWFETWISYEIKSTNDLKSDRHSTKFLYCLLKLKENILHF